MNIEYNMRGLLHAFFRQQLKFFLVFGVFAVMGLLMASRVASYYEARGSFLVKFGQGATLDIAVPNGSGRANDFSSSDRKELLESNIRILKSHSLLSDVVKKVGVDNLYPLPPVEGDDDVVVPDEETRIQGAVSRLLGGDLEVTVSGGSNVVELFVRNADPERAAQLAGTLMDSFIMRQAELYNSAQTSFLEKQIAEMKTKLDHARAEFSSFKDAVGISAIDEEMTQLLRQKSDLSTIAFQSVSTAQETLAELEAKEAEMRLTYNPDSPLLERLQESIAVAKRQLRERQDDLNALPGDAEGEDGSLSEKIAAIDERIAWLEAQRGLYNELEQRVLMDEQNYRYYQQRGEEARVNNLLKAENITRITIVDRPSVPLSPSGPNGKLVILAFLMAGAFLGLALALVLELLDDRFTAPEQITQMTGLPVLISFDKIKGV